MYKLIGIDQREYGPVSAEEVRQWIRESRANALTRARAEGSAEWRTLNQFPEFADLLSSPQIPPPYFPPPAQYYYPQPSGNGMATTGLIFGLVGLLCCCLPLFPILGLLFSIIGLIKGLKNPSRGGKAVALIGIILAVLELLFWAIMFALSVASDGHPINFKYSI